MQRSLPALVQVNRHGLGVIPPQLDRHALEEREGFDQSVQNRLGAFGRQRQGERRVRVTPGDDQDRNLTPALGEVDVDVAEVGLGTHARPMLQRDEGLAAVESSLPEVAADLIVLAGVPLLGDQTPVNLRGGVPLLARGGLIGGKDLIHKWSKRPEHRSRPRLDKRVGRRFGVPKGFANRVSPNAELLGDLTGTQPVSVGLSNPGKIVHSAHPRPPAAASAPHARVVLLVDLDWMPRVDLNWMPITSS